MGSQFKYPYSMFNETEGILYKHTCDFERYPLDLTDSDCSDSLQINKDSGLIARMNRRKDYNNKNLFV